MGDTARAAPMFDEALAMQRRVLGEQHPSTIRCSLMFACLHLRSGRLVEAQSLVAGVCAGSEQPRFNAVMSVFVRALREFYLTSPSFDIDMLQFVPVHAEAGNGKNDITGIADGLMMTNVEH